MATEVGAAPVIPQLQSVQKAMSLPAVGAAVGQVGAFYTKVKGAHSLLEWALSTAEASVTLAAVTAAPYVAAPLAAGDAKVTAALQELERRVPLVTEQPKVIVETTKQAVLSRITPQLNKVYGAREAAGQRVQSLKELTWARANALLTTAAGQRAAVGVGAGATYAMQLLDHYLPPTAEEAQELSSAVVGAAPSGEAAQAAQAVRRLSAVAARRVWANLAAAVQRLKDNGVELDVRRYVAALMAALHLATVTSEKPQAAPTPADEQQQPPTPANGHTPTATPSKTPTPPAEKVKPVPKMVKTPEKVKTTPKSKTDNGVH